MLKSTKNNIQFWQFELLQQFANLSHYIIGRHGGFSPKPYNSLNLSLSTFSDHENVIKNRQKLAATLNWPIESFVFQNQEHTNKITVVGQSHKASGIYAKNTALPANDGMVSNTPEITLCIFGADCVSILYYDPLNHVIGAAHAGWKGTLKNLTGKMVEKMQVEFGSNPSDIQVALGPSISPENYEVGNDVVEKVEQQFGQREPYLQWNAKSNKYHFDQWKTNEILLLQAGILPKNIQNSGICTFDNTADFFSARNEKETGRFATLIRISQNSL